MSGVADDRQTRAGDSTSSGLSSPNSPTQQTELPISHDSKRGVSFSHDARNGVTAGGNSSANTIAAKTIPAPKRTTRKKKEPDTKVESHGTSSPADPDASRPKKQRAPRGSSEQFKKRQRLKEEEKEKAEAHALAAVRQSSVGEFVTGSPAPQPNSSVTIPNTTPQNGNVEAIPMHHNYAQNLVPHPPRISGQHYDPIRSSTVAPRTSSPLAMLSTPPKAAKYSSASASPSIPSLMNPPDSMRPYLPSQSVPSQPEPKRPRLSPSPMAVEQITNQPAPNSTPVFRDAPINHSAPKVGPSPAIEADTPQPHQVFSNAAPTVKKHSPTATTTVSSSSHSPKPSRPKEKEAVVTLPSSGSGLLSGSIFGGGALDNSGPEKIAPTVFLHVPLTGDNQYVNFTRLAEERYGFNALHPRLAAQRERLARVAAAGAALENAHKNGTSGSGVSADEMSVDLSDAEADNSNIETGAVNGKSGEDTGEVKAKKKRVMKEDMYDKDDDFVDDTELAWEEQAAVSKDGFFVYSGLLVPEGEEAKVEKADGASTRGRGRGGGRGSRGGKGGGGITRGGATATAATAATTSKDGKPPQSKRATKALKEQMEREKAQRENLMVLASKPPPSSYQTAQYVS